ncbi:MAG: ATP-binding cassette domain-containing protein, partial [Actinomycetota bacterium]|nr:ATP-binding cassette domain-containing protein [Actinomycetota bacterium]
ALEGVTFRLAVGDLALVLGPTGSGKSTLLRLAAGLLVPADGDVAVDGVAANAAPRGRVGIVFQDPESQLFAETVLDDVAFGPTNLGRSRDAAREVARAALDTVGLDPVLFGPRSPFALSGGEARRAALAGVLALEPRYLLLDEPTAGLDARGRADVVAAVMHAREHAGVMVVTHEAEELLALADSVLALSEGRMVFAGSARDLINDPSRLESTGIAVPGVLAVQLAARRAGSTLPHLTLDPEEAARAIMAAGGWGA